MSNRPNRAQLGSDRIDLPLRSNSNFQPNFASGDLPSPRVGEIPPALSPLDAFALQGILLQKRFEEGQKNGRRISRLPPLTIVNEFSKSRPGFFRSTSDSPPDDDSFEDESSGQSDSIFPHSAPSSAREVNPDVRPKSLYPQIQADNAPSSGPMPFRSELSPVTESLRSAREAPDYFMIPRAQSPEAMEPRMGPVVEATPTTPASSTYPFMSKQRSRTTDSLPTQATSGRKLLPPRSPAAARSRSPRVTPGVRSTSREGSDLDGSFDSLPPGKLSTSSSISRSHSPSSPFTQSLPRSPSMSSEYSTSGLPRPAFNFSRPLSSAGATRQSFDLPHRQATGDSDMSRPSFDIPSRQASGDGPFIPYAGESVHTPVSMASEEYLAETDPNQPPRSYIYSKYRLPRGRMLQRESIGAGDFLNNQIHWDDPQPSGSRNNNNKNTGPSSTASPPSPPRSIDLPLGQREQDLINSSGASMASSNDTIKANMKPKDRTSGEMTAEVHLQKGIELHEQGSLQESTYHLRLAAKAGLPTAMLLYALACRHGWGMRPSQAEGVQWLKRAVDSAQLEVADDEDLCKKGKPSDIIERKTHKAQFALSVYELGVSYMNGWGIQQDKALALRCFEIAGNWGDSDALAEAGFCYTEGIGCKKDLKKAAKFYRQAAAKGMNMAGNSWIYKEKYMDDDSSRTGRSPRKDSSEKKPRDKSRTRTLFGRKKSVAA